MKIAGTNRKARRDYHILETYEAGIELKGNEVKSLRGKTCSLADSFGRIEKEELFLYNLHIPEFQKSSAFKTEPTRTRKLLIHKAQLRKLTIFTTQRGFSIVPLKVYFNERGLVKVEIAVAKGRHTYDKRKKVKEDIVKREAERTFKRHRKGA